MFNRLYKPGQLLDMHIHTQYTDGKFTVPELLKLAQQRGVDVLSFTDHDVLYANYEVRSMKDQGGFSGKFINGCEIAVSYKGKKYEVLAYDFDLDELAKFDALTTEFQVELECQRLAKLLELGKNLGFSVTPNLEFNPNFRTAHKCFFDDLAKYPENTELYHKYGIDKADNLYRDHMIRPGSLFHCYDIVSETPPIEYVCKKIHDAGGLAIFAHAFTVYGEKEPKQLVQNLHAENILDGFECIHKKFQVDESIWLYRYCLENNLIPTGGTDLHGDGFKINGIRYEPECLAFDKYSQLEPRFPILKTTKGDIIRWLVHILFCQ